MKKHPTDLGVQMAATACIYNLTKSEMGQSLHTMWLGRIVTATLNAMQSFPSHQQVCSIMIMTIEMISHFIFYTQLQKNALLTLCSDRILQEVV